MGMAGPFHPPFYFCTAAKRERAVDGPREKTPRRVGLRRRRPPAAGGGWLAVPCSSQGRKRLALGETFGPGKSGIPAAPLFAAAGRWSMRVAAWANATFLRPPGQRVATAQPLAALPLTDAACPLRASGTRGRRNQWNTGGGRNTGSAAARDSKRGAGQMRSCTPMTSAPSATGRQLQTCRREKRARRQAKIGACTDPPTPVARRRERAGARLSGLFFWTVHSPFSFPQEGKENGGCIPLDQPPAGAESPVAAGRRPIPCYPRTSLRPSR